MTNYQNKKRIDDAHIEKILKPYWTQFVGESYIMQGQDEIVLQSRFGVDAPWYCDSTGHMNAVELNLAFNQMMYVTIDHAITLGWIPALQEVDHDYFMQKYWPDFLITKIESEFKAPLLVNNLCGTLRIKKITPSTQHLWFELDLTVKPGSEDYPVPGDISHAYSKMNLVIKDYKTLAK